MKKIVTKKPVEKKFVVKRVTNTGTYDKIMYYTEEGVGFTDHFDSATKYTEESGLMKLGRLLHEHKEVCELLDVTTPYESPVRVGTALLNNRMGVAELIINVPQVKGDSLTLVSHTGTRKIPIQDFLECLVEEDLQVLWDPERSMVPECNNEYLDAHGFIIEDGSVRE